MSTTYDSLIGECPIGEFSTGSTGRSGRQVALRTMSCHAVRRTVSLDRVDDLLSAEPSLSPRREEHRLRELDIEGLDNLGSRWQVARRVHPES